MTGVEYIDWAIGAIGALATAYGLFVGARKVLVDARALEADPKTPYEMLEARVRTLEEADELKGGEISRLRTSVYRLTGILTREVHTLISWHRDGAAPPPPEKEIARIEEVIHGLIGEDKESNGKANVDSRK